MSTITNQQFEGKTIEEALSAAVDALGDDLEILDAQRVRKRNALGLRRKPVFEVVAAKRSLAEPKDFEDVLRRMTDRVDDAGIVDQDIQGSGRRFRRVDGGLKVLQVGHIAGNGLGLAAAGGDLGRVGLDLA